MRGRISLGNVARHAFLVEELPPLVALMYITKCLLITSNHLYIIDSSLE